MNAPACLPPICYSDPVPDSTPSPLFGAYLPPSFVKPSLPVRSVAIYSLCTFIEHLVSAGMGNTASAPIKLQNPVEGRQLLGNHVNKKSGVKCFEGQVRGIVRPHHTCWAGAGRVFGGDI